MTPADLASGSALLLTRFVRDALIIADADFVICVWNAAAEKIYGWRADEAVGRSGFELLRTEFKTGDRAAMLAAIQEQGYFRGECTQVDKSGRRLHIEADSTVLKDDQGKVTGYLSINRDITGRKQAETLIAEQRDFLKVLTDSLPGLVGFWDAEQRCGFANRNYREWFGVDPETMAGMHLRELLGEEVYAKNKPFVEAALRGETQIFERKLTAFDGKVRHSLAQYVPHLRDGRVLGFFVLVADVTAHKRIETQLQATLDVQKALSDNSAFAIIQCNVDGVIEFWNPAAESMLGYARDEVVGKQTPALFHDPAEVAARAAEWTAELKDVLGRPVKPGFEAFVIKSQLGMRNEAEWTYVHKSGRRFPVLLGVAAIRNAQGEITGYIGTAADVSKRKQLENELRVAKEAAERANQAKSEFLAAMSHEIRTPMNGVLGMVHALADTALNAEQVDLVDTLRQSGDLLLGIINDILDFTKIEAGKLDVHLEAVDAAVVAREALEIFRASAASKGLKLNWFEGEAADSWVCADPVRLKQVLLNLIGNAVKFTAAGEVTVAIKAHQEGVCLEVKDTGIGIPADKHGLIFERFGQADTSASRRFGGTGLGLAISKRLIGCMGGEMGFASEFGRGSTFWCRLSRWQGERAGNRFAGSGAPSAAPSWRPSPAALRVLLAEDNGVNRKVVTHLLGKWNCLVDVACDGQEAVAKAQEREYDLVLMDCQMPVLDGFGATRAIRAWEAETGRSEPHYIVALTAAVMSDERASCFESGMNAFLAKPLKPDEIRELIESRVKAR